MKFIPALYSRLVLAGLILALPAFTLVQAQVDNMPIMPAPTAPKPVPFALEIHNGVIIENGKDAGTATIGNILEYMKKQDPNFSIILGPGVAEFQLRELFLHLPDFSAADICASINASSDSAVISDEIRPGIFSLRLHDTPNVDVAVFNLSGYLNPNGDTDDKTIKDKLDSVIDIIQKTLHDLEPNAPAGELPQFQFHQGASLLVVTGGNPALNVANRVVNALAETPKANAVPVTQGTLTFNGDGRDPAAPATTDSNSSIIWSHADPAAARKLYAQLLDQEASLSASMQNNSLSPQQLLERQQQIRTINEMMQDLTQLSPDATPAPNGYVWVSGEIRAQPGLRILLPANEPYTVSEAIVAAGWTDFSKHVVFLERWEKDQDGKEQLHKYPVDVDAVLLKNQKDKDMIMQSGDIIFVDWSIFSSR